MGFSHKLPSLSSSHALPIPNPFDFQKKDLGTNSVVRPMWFTSCHYCPSVQQAACLITDKQNQDDLVPTLLGDLCHPSKSCSCMGTSSQKAIMWITSI